VSNLPFLRLGTKLDLANMAKIDFQLNSLPRTKSTGQSRFGQDRCEACQKKEDEQPAAYYDFHSKIPST